MFKTLKIEGMNCGHCAGLVKVELFKIKEVIDATVDVKYKNAIVQIEKPVDFEIFQKVVENAGYTLTQLI